MTTTFQPAAPLSVYDAIKLRQAKTTAIEYLFPFFNGVETQDMKLGAKAIAEEPENMTYRRMFADLMIESGDDFGEKYGRAMHVMLDNSGLALMMSFSINGGMHSYYNNTKIYEAANADGILDWYHARMREMTLINFLGCGASSPPFLVFGEGWLDAIHIRYLPQRPDTLAFVAMRKILACCPITRIIVDQAKPYVSSMFANRDGTACYGWGNSDDAESARCFPAQSYIPSYLVYELTAYAELHNMTGIYDSKADAYKALTRALIHAARRSFV